MVRSPCTEYSTVSTGGVCAFSVVGGGRRFLGHDMAAMRVVCACVSVDTPPVPWWECEDIHIHSRFSLHLGVRRVSTSMTAPLR